MTHKSIEKVSRILLVCLMAFYGCASHESLDSSTYDPSYDQTAITNLYRNRAAEMHEKANAQATAATRYEALFGPDASLVSGARSLASHYEQTAKEFERLAEAHASVGRTRQRPATVP
ncbi:MAG: hypothetical protein P0121_04480 [Nitrospira sp.]|nr:hypothetical protein [Nitrospira sp.]